MIDLFVLDSKTADGKGDNVTEENGSRRFLMRNLKPRLMILFLLIATSLGLAQQRKVIINQDCSGPGGSNMQTLLTLIQSPAVEVLGIIVVSGNH